MRKATTHILDLDKAWRDAETRAIAWLFYLALVVILMALIAWLMGLSALAFLALPMTFVVLRTAAAIRNLIDARDALSERIGKPVGLWPMLSERINDRASR
jgi:uncharacterized membrane protein